MPLNNTNGYLWTHAPVDILFFVACPPNRPWDTSEAHRPQNSFTRSLFVGFFFSPVQTSVRTIPAHIKYKIGTSTPPLPKKNPTPPPPRNEKCFGHGRTQKMSGAHKINWCSHFRPQTCGRKNYGHQAFSESGSFVGQEIQGAFDNHHLSRDGQP